MANTLKVCCVLLTLAIGFGCGAHHPFRHTDCPDPATVTVLCEKTKITVTDDDQEPADEAVCVNTDQTITWKLDNASPDGTKLTIHEFKKKKRIGWDKDRKPMPASSYDADKQNPASAKVKVIDEEGKPLKGLFKYSVTCTFQDGSDKKKDPMIEVPK